MRDFVFPGRLRRTARAVVDAMVPRWDDFPKDITDEVLDEVEDLIRQMPLTNQVALTLMVAGLEFGAGPLAMDGLRPLSTLDRDRTLERLERLADHPIAQVRLLPMLLGTLISLSAWSREDVEAHVGVPRRRWRRDRRRLRASLVRIDEGRAPSAPPTPLGSAPVVTPDALLRFVEEREAQAAEAAG